MLIGIMSDSHGQAARVGGAVRLLERLGAEQLVHCGDVGGISVLEELVGHRCGLVWGNTDRPDGTVAAFIRATDLTVPAAAPLRLAVDGKTILVFHGHEAEFDRALHRQAADYILHGHTHVPRDERVGDIRVINPGALHRARRHTVATLDPAADVVSFHELDT